jgi:hypothetical protein
MSTVNCFSYYLQHSEFFCWAAVLITYFGDIFKLNFHAFQYYTKTGKQWQSHPSWKISVFWDITLCSPVKVNWLLLVHFLLGLFFDLLRWRCYIPLKHWVIFTRLYSITPQRQNSSKSLLWKYHIQHNPSPYVKKSIIVKRKLWNHVSFGYHSNELSSIKILCEHKLCTRSPRSMQCFVSVSRSIQSLGTDNILMRICEV